jgi:TonB family protein
MIPGFMRAANTFSLVQNNLSPIAPFAGPAQPYAPPRERTAPAMLSVALLHAVAIFGLFYTAEAQQPVPTLAFTVTMMDLSSSQNAVSSAASAASEPAEKPALKKAAEKPVPVRVAKTPAKRSHQSQAQTAVISPVSPAQFDAAYLNNPQPEYPLLSRRMGEQGNVMLSAYVSEDGRAEIVRLAKSSGFTRLDDAAISAVKSWRFAAARQGSRVLASWVQVPVKFVLE